MADIFTKEKRSSIMSKIHGRDTKPELTLEDFFKSNKIKYRKHVKDLPGKPDFVLDKSKTVIFVNGCFWHGHKKCKRAKLPSSNKQFWTSKIASNTKRDRRNHRMLRKDEWSVIVFWTCKPIGEKNISSRLKRVGIL